MNRLLLQSGAFLRTAKRLVKRNPQVAGSLRDALEQLAQDAFHPTLKTHKLSGELQGTWACSAGYDLRIVFSFVPWENQEAILLHSIGTHEEVY
ncbi:MAG: type II toxin-antitoxin system mRNA interferase toxin, RelE/StbE family [Pirellulales bacterium]|nr:type II toxin-antitoxin system mRNA interferase toxin, RelE/StbE family [Pirellulales bacterium]